MPIPSIYINLEDDVGKVVQRVKKEKAVQVVLVCPKRCLLLSDSINLRLLKKQADMLGKEIFILTMDERGQTYAVEAGFQLKFLPKAGTRSSISDIRISKPIHAEVSKQEISIVRKVKPQPMNAVVAATVANTVSGIRNFVERKTSPKIVSATALPKIKITDAVYPPQEAAYTNQKRSSIYGKFILGMVVISLLVIVVLNFVVLPKATVAVYPKNEPITRDWDISFSSAIQQVDSEKLILPATKISQTITVQNKFQSQGKREVGNKAAGTVVIYNFTRAPINLKANTTTLLIGSKTYLLVTDAMGIKPTTYKNATTKEVDTASLSAPIEVLAADGGESFNVPAGTRMEVTNQVFGSKPQFLFAKTQTPVTGGTSRFLSVVSSQDIVTAQESLSSQAIGQLTDSMKTQNLAFVEKSYTMENLGFTTDKQANTESPTFQGDLTVKITGLAFNTEDLKKLISDRVTQTLSAGKTLTISSDDQLSYKLKNLDLNNETGVMSVHFEGKAVYTLDVSDISAELVNKSQAQVNEILRSKSEIDKIETTLAPSWQKNFPFFASKIHVYVAK